MEFPEYLDPDDMKLAMKEWRLTGLYVQMLEGTHPLRSKPPARSVLVCWSRHDKHFVGGWLADFTERLDGVWVRVASTGWKETTEEAEAYVLP